jgi:hypothetical protein
MFVFKGVYNMLIYDATRKSLFLKNAVFLEVGESALLVCGRRVSGGCTPLRGTIVNNVDTARSKQAFRSRVSTMN